MFSATGTFRRSRRVENACAFHPKGWSALRCPAHETRPYKDPVPIGWIAMIGWMNRWLPRRWRSAPDIPAPLWANTLADFPFLGALREAEQTRLR